MTDEKPLILVTNDDGISAKGIRELISIVSDIGEVYVVAPNKGQSGMSHAITVDSILNIEEINTGKENQKEFSCSGTPVDCVKLAFNELLPRKPALCVSGINHGSNASVNVMYSGTMAAAIEASIKGVASIGFSLLDNDKNANFETSKSFIKDIILSVINNSIPTGVTLNVNIPKTQKIEGIRICRQAKATWNEEFDRKTNPRGETYFWLTGDFVNLDDDMDTDLWALENNYISIVPVKYDFTDYTAINELNKWDL